jgi:hypothetical protein
VGWQRGEKSAFSGIKKIGNNKKWQLWERALPPVKFSPAKLEKAVFMSPIGKMTAGFVKKMTNKP